VDWIVIIALYITVLLWGIGYGYRIVSHNPSIPFDKVHHHIPWINRIGIGVLCIIAFLFFSLIMDRLAQQLPYIVQKEMVHIVWVLLGLFLALLSGFTLFMAFKKHKILFAGFVVLINLLFAYVAYTYNRAVYYDIQALHSDTIYIEQTSLYSCAPTAFAMIARSYGLNLNEREATHLMGTTELGTTAGQIRSTLKTLGFSYEMLNQNYTNLDLIQTKAILFVDRRGGYENHSVAYFGRVDNRYKLLDPMEGERLLSQEELHHIWHGNGVRIYR